MSGNSCFQSLPTTPKDPGSYMKRHDVRKMNSGKCVRRLCYNQPTINKKEVANLT